MKVGCGIERVATFGEKATQIWAIKEQKPWIDALLHQSGAILFKGLPVNSRFDFNDVVEAFGYEELPYGEGGTPRTNVIGRVFTANEFPPDQKIPFHHEMAREQKPWIDALLHQSGAILFKGLPVNSRFDFNDVVEAFGYEELPYGEGGTPRTNVIGRVFTANEFPPDQKIPFHHEMARVVYSINPIFQKL
nr:clavaminate synthase-like protein At3g21360 [Ipomoea batatas]